MLDCLQVKTLLKIVLALCTSFGYNCWQILSCTRKPTDFNKLFLCYFVIKYLGFSSIMLNIIVSDKPVKFEI
jgi:hypothetical protein